MQRQFNGHRHVKAEHRMGAITSLAATAVEEAF
jgi:hypothetical protein